MIKKIAVIIFLSLIIIFSFSFSFLFYIFNVAPPENSFSQKYRQTVLQNYVLKEFLRLNQPGDARYDLKNNQKIRIDVYYQNDLRLRPDTLPRVVLELKQVLADKDISYDAQPLGIEINPVINDEGIKELLKQKPVDWSFMDSTARVQIFVLKEYEEVPTYVGLVQDANNIFLFMNMIKDVSDQQESSYKIEVSTILHEFAHLLGADHVEAQDCILNERVENVRHGMPVSFRTSFCQQDIEEINKALNL
jgi:hypothetical protein